MLWDNPPHRISTYSVVSGTDPGGGNTSAFTLAQSGVKCLINTASSSTRDLYARDEITVTHTIGIKSALLTTAITPGMKAVATDTNANYHVKGIRNGRAAVGLPAFTYLDCEELL